MSTSSQRATKIVRSAEVSTNFDTKRKDAPEAELLSIALIGPDEGKRSAVARALAETRRADVREFDSYPPEVGNLHGLLAVFDVIVLDLDSEPAAALELVDRASADGAATIVVYSENTDPKLAIRCMRAGASEYLLLPIEHDVVGEALARIETAIREKGLPGARTVGGLHVFAGSKGGSGVTTVACNIAVALAEKSDQSILLIDLALPIGDAALCLGISAGYSTEDALRNIDRLDASLLRNLLVQHRSGVMVLAAPTKVPEVEVSKGAIDKLIAIARREFDHVIVDVGSRIDVAAKVLIEEASTIYLVTQTGISELRNSNRLISQFFAEGHPNLEIVINRFESRFLETVNEDIVAKALGKPVRWKIPDDQDAARALQYGDTGRPETRISRISREMAGSISGRPVPKVRKKELEPNGTAKNIARVEPVNTVPATTVNSKSADGRMTPVVTWPTPGPITYGERLTFAQLNATASVEGTFAYTPDPGYVLPVGAHTLWVTFTPVDTSAYSPLQAAVSIVVTKATPAIFWPTPDGITYGTALDEAQLNATAPVPGRLSYSPAEGELLPPGVHTLSVTFTPADTANYATAQSAVTLSVAKATSVIQWPTPDPITYGTQIGPMHLCAAASVPGKFEYTPGLGAVLAAGEHRLSVAFTPEDAVGYSSSQAAVSLRVAKATPAIGWRQPDPISCGAAIGAAQLNARATVPGSFAYTPAAGEIMEPGAHELTAVFTPVDTLNYTTSHAAVPLIVTEKSPTVITWPTPSAISYGTALSDAQLNATASVAGTFVYTPSAGHVLAPGRYKLTASFTPSDTEQFAAAQATVGFEVEGLAHVESSHVDSAPMDSTPAETTEPSTAWTFATTSLVHPDSAPAEAAGERAATKTSQRETRTYKGAVYEKGEDGKWHLQKN
jgi:MinD-like ATPase involved in chromosome partitioning or flagellar assembly/CheY-like chemotaxis protein